MRPYMKLLSLRRTWLLILISVTAALFVMLLYYIHWTPEKEVTLYFEPLENRNAETLGNEYRINYIMTDESFLPLNIYADQVYWRYDGALVTYSQEPLSFSVTAKRKVEISMKRGTYMGTGIVGVDGDSQTIDFYFSEDNNEWLIKHSVNSFWNRFSIAIGLSVFCSCFCLLMELTRRKKFPPCLEKTITFSDSLTFVCIVFFSILFCINATDRVGAKGIFANMDIGIYVAGGKKILNGFVPYVRHYEEKGPVILLLCALGEWIWFPYGVHILTVILFLVGMFFLYSAMRLFFSKYVSLLGLLGAFLLCKAYHSGGINTEILSIPFISVAMYIFVRYLKSGKIRNGWLVLCGSCFAATLLMRVSNAWIWVAGVPMILFLTVKKETLKVAFQKILWMGLGVSFVFLPIVGWLALNGAVKEWLMDTIFYFGLYKSDISFIEKIWNGASTLNQTGLKCWWYIPVAVGAYDAYLVSRKKLADSDIKLFFYVAAALGYFCAILSGRVWRHNVLMLLPICSFLGAHFIEIIQNMLRKNAVAATLVPVMLLCAAAKDPFIDIVGGLRSSSSYFGYDRVQMLRLSNYIQSYGEIGTEVEVFSTNGGLGAMLENTLSGINVGTYAYLPFSAELRAIHMEKYMEDLEKRPEFIAATRTIDAEVSEFIYDNYQIVLETSNYILFQHKQY